MKKYLAKYKDNWADEIDVSGFRILTEKEKESLLKRINKCFKGGKSYSFYIGTNEEIEYCSEKEALSRINFVEISDEEFDTLKKLFGKDYGFFPEFERY